eukprot:c10964_g1_i1.p1 GENE.c10964_g1_i1~~c10964_g1_i1.p1  ORF type:complete len:183 (-),score=34.88 c10964_g1_i1:755-1303(-)
MLSTGSPLDAAVFTQSSHAQMPSQRDITLVNPRPQPTQRFTKPSYITDHIYLGDETSATNLEFLRESNIDRILIASFGLTKHFQDQGISYLQLDISDSPSTNITQFFDQAIEFITRTKQTNVLIHCKHGVSRSASIVMAYLIKVRGMDFGEAMQLTKCRRNVVCPNSGFTKQLISYAKVVSQ